jgi:hypothetical protein
VWALQLARELEPELVQVWALQLAQEQALELGPALAQALVLQPGRESEQPE